MIATRADYISDAPESERLLKKAYELAVGMGESRSALLIALSLVDMHLNSLKSSDEARKWLELAERLPASAEVRDKAEISVAKEALRAITRND